MRVRWLRKALLNLDREAEYIAQDNPKAAAEFVLNSIPIIKQIQATGLTSLSEVAAALNARGIRSSRGG